ncbi:MAG TPA: nickel pincer cofactor biosynthesis protein LarC [Bryobacteraceae bacterium]
MRICHFDPFSGISGDMTVGALLDAGADRDALFAALDSLGTGATFRLEEAKRKGIGASKFYVDGGVQKNHRHLPEIQRMINGSTLMTARAKQWALRIFDHLAVAEASVHRVPMEKVHFHEVGAVDSICDIAGAAIALDMLGVERVTSSAINTGSGTVKADHGVMPVPAPATAKLLEGKPVYARGPEMELTTPTGAAILSALGDTFGPMPAARILKSGYGAGDKDFPQHANVLRAIIAETTAAPESTLVSILESNIDDSTPEVLGYTLEKLFELGALDVSYQPLQMKKNRPGTLLRVVARPEQQEALAEAIFKETSTLGLRVLHAERRVRARESKEVDLGYGKVRMKITEDGATPEYDDCRALAIETAKPLRQVMADAVRSWNCQQ